MVHSCNLAAVAGMLLSVLLLEENSIDDAADGDDDDNDIDGERSHGLIAKLHVLAAEAVNHVWHGFVVDDVLLVWVLEPGPELLQAAALGLLRQRPVVEPPCLLLAQHVVHLSQADELLRRHLERQRRRVRVVLLGQPPVRRLDLLDVRLWRYAKELVVRLGRVVDEVRESPSQRLVLAAAAAVAFLLGLASYPPFVGVGPVYPGVHRLLLPRPCTVRRRRSRFGVGRARGCDHDCLRAPLVPVEDGREDARGRGRCHGKRVC